ncbi:uncharacterized protein TRIADDRAFT_26661 [Trichoplax adhaerens]|uniref:Zinc transporter ZIP9 n=1 Tax=Trichoplax adhaerens TaxID=10228 RepID=B3S0H1_TRIAD|nr:hypothetical protein TRIADDRAFT_26661 [Trichoplax adhaerens]EDV23639.1 hypothetical protein TRIADDRAFT_26661 [Trichoplax adhaerens]|eukprot:XP_002113165.1 hypothetical protein TRIADDRAFT_26661 [Trichoplax adhaerens]
MADITAVLFLSLAMFVGCYLAGLIPLSMNLSEKSLKITSCLGAGMLVGTALAVIIPEGIEAIYSINQRPCPIPRQLVKGTQIQNITYSSSTGAATMAKHSHSHGNDVHSLVGIALCFGFVVMLLVDYLSGLAFHNQDPEGGNRVGRAGITATIGLIVHAAADGVALGAAAATSRSDVETIVFIAIMLHKAPAAFGLCSFLLHEGCNRYSIRKQLLAFSLAAPVMAIATFYILTKTGQSSSTMEGTGLAMLFSAGTFLYVATVHVLPEDNSNNSNHGPHMSKLSKLEITVMVLGTFLPILLSLNHHH